LPHGSPLSVAARSEQHRYDGDSVSSKLDSQRPSEQWEVVMEDIPELPEGSSRATLSSLRGVAGNTPDEFGTGGGSKCQSSHPLTAQPWPIFDMPLFFSLQCELLAQGDSQLIQLHTDSIDQACR
jgi:hypothetical protein